MLPQRARLFLIISVVGVLGLAGVQVSRVVASETAADRWAPAELPGGVTRRAVRDVPAAPRVELDLELSDGTTVTVQISPRGSGPPPYLTTAAHQVSYSSTSGHREVTPAELGHALDAVGAHVRRQEAAGQRLSGPLAPGFGHGLVVCALLLIGLGVLGTLRAGGRHPRPRPLQRRGWLIATALTFPLLAGTALRWNAAPPALCEDERIQLRDALGVRGTGRHLNEGLPQPAQSALLRLLASGADSRGGLQAGLLLVSLVAFLAAGVLAAPPVPSRRPGRLTPCPLPDPWRDVAATTAVSLGGLVVGLSPGLVLVATNLRGYSLGVTAGILAVLALAHAPRRPVAGPVLFLLCAALAGLAHPLALIAPGAAYLVVGGRALKGTPIARSRALSILVGLTTIALLLLPDLVLAVAYHAGDPDPDFRLSRLVSLCDETLGLPWWLLLAIAAVAVTRLHGPSALPAAALLASLTVPLLLAPWGRIEGRHLLFAVPFLGVLVGRAAADVLTRRRLVPGLLLGALLLAGAGGYWRALPGAAMHETRALGRLGLELQGTGPVLVSPEPAATPVLDARLDLTPRELAQVEFERVAPGVQQAVLPATRSGPQPIVLRTPAPELAASLAALRAGARDVAVVAPDPDGEAPSPGPDCRAGTRWGYFRLWHCAGGP